MRRATPPRQVVIDLGLTAHANAALHYDARKKHVVKQVRPCPLNPSPGLRAFPARRPSLPHAGTRASL